MNTGAKPYVNQCRLWSKALLNYPVTFSEVFTKEQDFVKCVDVYNYWELRMNGEQNPLKLRLSHHWHPMDL